MAMKTRIQTSDEVVDVGGGLLLLAGFLYWFGLIGGPVHHPAGPAWSSENQKQEDQKNNHLTKIQRKGLQYHDNKTLHGKLRSRVNVTEGFVSEREQQVRLGKQNKHWKYQNSPLCHFSCKDCKDHFIFSSALWEIKQLWLYTCMNMELNWFKVAIMEIEMRWRWPCMTQMLKM